MPGSCPGAGAGPGLSPRRGSAGDSAASRSEVVLRSLGRGGPSSPRPPRCPWFHGVLPVAEWGALPLALQSAREPMARQASWPPAAQVGIPPPHQPGPKSCKEKTHPHPSKKKAKPPHGAGASSYGPSTALNPPQKSRCGWTHSALEGAFQRHARNCKPLPRRDLRAQHRLLVQTLCATVAPTVLLPFLTYIRGTPYDQGG